MGHLWGLHSCGLPSLTNNSGGLPLIHFLMEFNTTHCQAILSLAHIVHTKYLSHKIYTHILTISVMYCIALGGVVVEILHGVREVVGLVACQVMPKTLKWYVVLP